MLTYTAAPLPADQDLVGPVSAKIFARAGRRYADLFVRVCDVDGNGVSRNIVDGIRRLSPQTVAAADVQVDGDGVMAVDVTLYPTAYRVKAGHRIRVQVSAGAFPRYAAILERGSRSQPPPRPCGAVFEVFHSSWYPAHVLLPLLPAGVSGAAITTRPGSS
ncbi:MAG: CocE/NonD family hydrolase [Actinomycetota bacterium]